MDQLHPSHDNSTSPILSETREILAEKARSHSVNLTEPRSLHDKLIGNLQPLTQLQRGRAYQEAGMVLLEQYSKNMEPQAIKTLLEASAESVVILLVMT